MLSPRVPERKSGRLRGFMLSKDAWNQSLRDHKRRLDASKSCVNTATPWQAPKRAQSARQPKQPRPPTVAAASKAATQAAVKDHDAFGIDDLDEDDQKTCRAMVDLLMRLKTQECKSVVEEVFVSAEEQRLLQDYAGVFPSLTSTEGGEGGTGEAKD